MKKNKKIILFTILLLLFNTNVYASCTEEEINDFKKIEDEYKITYEFNKETKGYTLFIKSPYPEKFAYEINEGIIKDIAYKEIDNNTFSMSKVQPGEYKISVIGVTKTCNDAMISYTLSLPKYNIYSEDPLCIGLDDFVLCQPTYDKEIDYETFVSRVNTEIKRRKKEQKIPIEEQKEENTVIEYLKSNLVQIIIIVVFVIMLIITIILMSKSIKKSRRLE